MLDTHPKTNMDMYTEILNTQDLGLFVNFCAYFVARAVQLRCVYLIHDLVYCYVPNTPPCRYTLHSRYGSESVCGCNNLSSVKCGSNALLYSAKPYRAMSMSVFVRTC